MPYCGANATSSHLIDHQFLDICGEIGDLLVNIRWGTYLVDLPRSFKMGTKVLGVSLYDYY